jgi:multisubunit Na+/H+ antiporter MnhC subunit
VADPVFLLLFTGLFLFLTGVFLLLTYRNLLRLVLAVEVVAKGVTLVLFAAGVQQGELAVIQAMIVTFIVVETVLAAVLLAIVVVCQRTHASLDVRLLSRLKG